MNAIQSAMGRIEKFIKEHKGRDNSMVEGAETAHDILREELQGGAFVDVDAFHDGEFCCLHCRVGFAHGGVARCTANGFKNIDEWFVGKQRPSWCPAYVAEGK